MDTTNSNLSLQQLLSTLRVPSSYILGSRSEDFNHLRANVALPIRKTVTVIWHGKQQALLRLSERIVTTHVACTITPFVTTVPLVSRRSGVLMGVVRGVVVAMMG